MHHKHSFSKRPFREMTILRNDNSPKRQFSETTAPRKNNVPGEGRLGLCGAEWEWEIGRTGLCLTIYDLSTPDVLSEKMEKSAAQNIRKNKIKNLYSLESFIPKADWDLAF